MTTYKKAIDKAGHKFSSCTGALAGNRTVLTAGHCFKPSAGIARIEFLFGAHISKADTPVFLYKCTAEAGWTAYSGGDLDSWDWAALRVNRSSCKSFAGKAALEDRLQQDLPLRATDLPIHEGQPLHHFRNSLQHLAVDPVGRGEARKSLCGREAAIELLQVQLLQLDQLGRGCEWRARDHPGFAEQAVVHRCAHHCDRRSKQACSSPRKHRSTSRPDVPDRHEHQHGPTQGRAVLRQILIDWSGSA